MSAEKAHKDYILKGILGGQIQDVLLNEVKNKSHIGARYVRVDLQSARF